MSRIGAHYRILEFPGDVTMGGGVLGSIRWETGRRGRDLVMDYQALQLDAPGELFERGGKPWERVRGLFVPRRLRFLNANLLQGETVGPSLEGLAADHPDRLIYSGLAWGTPEGEKYYLLDLLRQKDDTLLLTVDGCLSEARDGSPRAVEFERDWSPPPLSKARLIPMPRKMWEKFGGDPVTVHLGGKTLNRRLFVGGLEQQTRQRPTAIGTVLNLGDQPSRWCEAEGDNPADRWDRKGEGSHGMDAAELARQAQWVIERLRQGQRVLVHCSAGMNRSASVCCAVLIAAEGLNAEQALQRVRENHPWTRSDPRHWLELRKLASQG